jgi:alpha-beta hydrolase superfamily lysophospholipase
MSVTKTKPGVEVPYAAGCASHPVTFDGTVGLFTPARGVAKPLSVLFASPWGLEEMCCRSFYRILAERLAENGFSSLRFDYPGTGDSLADDADKIDFKTWTTCFSVAAHELRQLSGCSRVVVVSQGIGAAVAIRARENGEQYDAIALLAPVVSGRFYARELSALAQVIDEKLHTVEPVAAGMGLRVAGLSMAQALVDDVRTIDLMKLDTPPAARSIVFARAERPADLAFADHLARLGSDVVQARFGGYAKLTTNPTTAVLPDEVINDLMAWIEEICPKIEAETKRAVAQTPVPSHGLGSFTEEPVRFGENGRLFGILCKPSLGVNPRSVSVLLLSSGHDRMSGWARSSVRLARALAAQDISSLRFDCAGVADSPSSPGFAGQVLYDAIQVKDVQAALDLLGQRLPETRIIGAGRCSGAYLALQAARDDERLAGVVAVNPVMFEWPAGRSVEDALANPMQSMDHYVGSLWKMEKLKRVLRGEIDLAAKFRQVSNAALRRLLRPLIWPTGGVTPRERIVCAGFRALARRQVSIRLLYSPGDIGLEEFGHFFGGRGWRLKRFAHMSYAVVAGADHNFTPYSAQKAYLESIVEMADSLERQPPVGPQ